jgi:hypothetical protein
MTRWSTGGRTRKDFPPGSRFFLVRTCKGPRGVIGYGSIPDGEIKPDDHWDPRKVGRKATYVKINFENLIDPEKIPKR